MLAAAAAPAFVRPASLMRIYVPKPQIITLWGDGVHDDTAALRMLLMGGAVRHGHSMLQSQDGVFVLPSATFLVTDTVVLSGDTEVMHVRNAKFVASERLPLDKPMFYVDNDASATITGCHFNRGLEFRPCA
jgi:hypothetical protein